MAKERKEKEPYDVKAAFEFVSNKKPIADNLLRETEFVVGGYHIATRIKQLDPALVCDVVRDYTVKSQDPALVKSLVDQIAEACDLRKDDKPMIVPSSEGDMGESEHPNAFFYVLEPDYKKFPPIQKKK